MKRQILFAILIFTLFIGCKDQAEESHDMHFADIGKVNGDSYDRKTSEFPKVNYSVEQLDNTKGLSNSSVNCIFQDSQKLLWVGTWDGLNRYDGTNFKIFRPGQDNKNALSNQVILKIGEDNTGQIWIATMHGINRYNKKSGTFEHYYFSRKNKPPLSESEFNMALNADKQVFCAVKEWGLGYFNGTDFKTLNNNNFKGKTVRKIEFSTSGKLLVLYDDNQLYALTIATKSNGAKTIFNAELILNGVKTFCVLPNTTICTISITNEAQLLTLANNKRKIIGGNIEAITGHIPEGVVLSGKSGYTVINAAGNEVKLPWSKYLNNQKITTIEQGNENITWTGTDGDGVFKMFPLKKQFNLISKTQLPELNGGIVRAFLKLGENSFLLGTKGNGLFMLDPDFYLEPEKLLAYKNFDESNSSVNNAVFALSKGNDGLVYIGTDGEGITIYDNQKKGLVSWKEIEGSNRCEYFKSVYSVFEDKDGDIWIGTNGYGMIKCKIQRAGSKLKVTHFKRYNAGNGSAGALSSNIVFSIIPKSSNELWIGTRLGGLNLFNKQTGLFKTYKNVASDPQSLSNNDILCLVTDSDNKLWIGTSFGLNVLTELKADGTATFKNYTVKDGLPDNTIHGIVPDEKSNLWVSTNFGLSNFITNTAKFTNYSKNEGLQNNEFSDGAFYSDAQSGYIFMGGIKGFNYFLPQKIKESTIIPDLLIDRISGQNEPLPYYQGLVISPVSKKYPSIVLKHDQNFFDIHLAALTYTSNEKCQYAYQLNGFDDNWNAIGNRKIISFTNVPRGNYSLWVKWSNSDGVWSRPVHAADIRIKPVWWQSNLALILYTGLAIFFMLFVRSYYLKKQSLKQNILIRKNEEEIHENRLTFFTNIAHEFLTPLTLIVGPVQKLAEAANPDDRNRKFINMIQRNASRLLFLTQELLEFRKAEHDYLGVNVKKFDLVNLIEQIAELFDDWALDKNITYRLDIPNSLPGWFDKDKLEKIVFNLMSNAFKYTPVNGTINIKCHIEKGKHKNLNITITNTGKGIPKEKLDLLFDRFFLSDANQTTDTDLFRTGIGLAYIKKLVTVLRGEIIVSSIANEQTTFTILLPCEKAAFSEKEINLEKSPVLISHHLKNLIEENEENSDVVPHKILAVDSVENKRKTILIVEDEKEIQLFLNDLLSSKYKILSAYNGIDALKVLETEIPDIIISDVMMPLMDGVDLCKKVKTDLATCHIPFIMLTAKNSVLHRIEGLESGANSYIPKPFYPDHLLIRIQKLLEEKELILKHFTQEPFIGNISELPKNNDEKVFIKSVIDLIRKNIDSENLNSAFIENALGISNSQLYRKIKDIFSVSPGDLIRTIRLKHAAELLRKNELTVSEICYKSGFNNRSYFYREFNKMYSTTPKNYQIQYKSKGVTFSNN